MSTHINARRWFVAIALVCTLALAAACGSTGDSDQPARDETRPGTSSGSDGSGSNDLLSATQGESPAAVVVPATDSGGASLPALLDRKLIRTATIQIETEEVTQRYEEIGNIAVSAGGLVFSSSFGNDGEQQNASITVRVPNDRYQDVLIALRKLGEVKTEQSNASDVTEEFTDLQSNLTNLQATEREYLKLLARAETIDEILVVQDRINGTRAQIEQVQGRLNLLGNQTDLATITAHLTPPLVQKASDDTANSPLEVAQEAWQASLAVLMGIAVVLIAIGAFSWWLLPLAALGWYLGRRQLQRDRERRQAPPPAA